MHILDVLGMETDQITEQKIAVLKYFIQNESYLLDRFTPDQGVLYQDNETHTVRFYSYPKRIEDDLKGQYNSISRTWAATVCKDLETLGILDHRMIKAARQKNPTEHYYLRSGPTAIKAAIKILLENPIEERVYFTVAYQYIRSNINEDLVRAVLAEKKTVMKRDLDIWDWAPNESRKVYEIYYTKKAKMDKRWGSESANDPYARSFESYCAEMIRTESDQNRESYHFPPPRISYRFPVFGAELSEKERDQILASENKELFKEYPDLNRYPSVIREHYQKFERDKWILPILALIRTSGNALYEFLFGNWKPYNRAYGTESLDFPIFSFLFTTMKDIAQTRDISDGCEILSVQFRPDFQKSHSSRERPALLEIRTTLNLTVCYDASFNTEHIYYGSENGDVWENDTEQNYEVSTWIEISARGTKLKTEDIKDFSVFVLNLLDSTNPISRRIVERLSHRMQHLIWAYIPTDNAYPFWGETLLYEIDRILSVPGFYDPRVFAQVKLTQEGKSIVEKSGTFGHIDFDSLYHSVIFDLNRILFEESYPDLVNRSKYFESDRQRMIVGN